MIFGDSRVEFALKRILGLDDFRERFFDYLDSADHYLVKQLYPTPGWFEPVAMTGSGADAFAVTAGVQGPDGDSHIVETASSFSATVPFQNALGISYYAAVHWAEKPVGVEVNPKTGYPDYTQRTETIGQSGIPDSLTVPGGTQLRFIIDSVAEAGVSNAGRSCLVWMVIPAHDAITPAIAVETCAVQWDGTNNYILTTGLLGQTAPSTNPIDYVVLLEGLTVRRNTDLRSSGEHAFIGIVTGAGAGNPPTIFDTSDQIEIVSDLSSLNDVIRQDVNGHLKIRVRSYAGEVAASQIRVDNPLGVTKFNVDEQGNVNIQGNLVVQGTTQEYNTETVYASETVTGNLTAGDTAGDQHTIRGSWTHLYSTSSTAFNVDGTTGHVGLFCAADPTNPITLGGHTVPSADNAHDLGTLSNRWRNLYVVNLSFSGDFLPVVDNTQDLGSSSYRWAELYVGTRFFLTGDVQGNINPSVTNTYSLGGASLRWNANLNILNLNLLSSDLLADTTLSRSLGSVSKEWLKVWTRNLGVSGLIEGHLIPLTDTAWDMGQLMTPALWWNNLYIRRIYLGTAAGQGFATNVLPTATHSFTLGAISYRWSEVWTRNLYVNGSGPGTGAPGYGVATDLIPCTTGDTDLGSFDYHWAVVMTDSIYLDTTGDHGFISHCKSAIDKAYDLGTASYRWRRAYLTYLNLGSLLGEGVESHLIPTTDNAFNLGNNTYRYALIYTVLANIGSLTVNSGSGIGVVSSLIPGTTNAYSLGNSSYYWSALYARTIYASTAAGYGIGSALMPNATNALDLGSTSYRWAGLYLRDLYLSTEADHGCVNSFLPNENGAIDLGTSARRWSSCYVGMNVDINSQLGGSSGNPNLSITSQATAGNYTPYIMIRETGQAGYVLQVDGFSNVVEEFLYGSDGTLRQMTRHTSNANANWCYVITPTVGFTGWTAGTHRLAVNGGAYKTDSASWSWPSDERFKTDIRDLSDALGKNGLEILSQLRPRVFKMTEKFLADNQSDEFKQEDGKIHDPIELKRQVDKMGFISQEVDPILPQWVDKPNGDEPPWLLTLAGYEALVVDALRVVKSRLEAIESRLTAAGL